MDFDAVELIRLLKNGWDGKALPNRNAIVSAVAKIEFESSLRGHPVDFLGPLVEPLFQVATGTDLSAQIDVLEQLEFFSFARVLDSVEIIRRIRSHSPLIGEAVMTYENVFEELPLILFKTGQYARTDSECKAVLDEMAALLKAEMDLPNLRLKRAEDLFARLISGKFASSYAVEAFAMAKRSLLNMEEKNKADAYQLTLATALIFPFLSNVRTRSHLDGDSLIITSSPIGYENQEYRWRTELLEILRRLTRSCNEEVSQFAWRGLKEAHSKVIFYHYRNTFEKCLYDDLEWIRGRLREGMCIHNLQQARDLWQGHLEDNSRLKDLADECEAIYLQNDLIREYHVFFQYDQSAGAKGKAQEVGATLGTKSSLEIRAYLQGAIQFAGENTDWGMFLQIVDTMALHWESNAEISVFINSSLCDPNSQEFRFATKLLEARLKSLRHNNLDSSIKELLEKSYTKLENVESQSRFLLLLYSWSHPLRTGSLKTADFDFLLGHLTVFKEDWKSIYGMLGGMFYIDWSRLRTTVDNFWRGYSR